MISQSYSYDSVWRRQLSVAVPNILRGQTDHLSIEEVYRAAYGAVINKCADRLLNDIRQCVFKHLRSVDIPPSGDPQALLEHYKQFKNSVRLLTNSMMYMERTYLAQYQMTLSVICLKIYFDSLSITSLDKTLAHFLHSSNDQDSINNVSLMILELQQAVALTMPQSLQYS
ncbi:hypothetical protein SAMD00019534_079490 [Acytostelium subglobosum LB1]|uniref:hypothetical protein n=1 Tax=Acytostelium subglobosum LB1 TaxID=1410327 RepID=UPI000644BE72|nr:hypothetical protein SAMD00019534_079490 [Acytostelium subglobosum LB1]GAM24774.1 hypothetical protein SAMD00019534_079490 [Acytostelium subglobosum LB1]|eukprot:XP_012752443.1 hypothetical protein SAMD00019534_079490 [Acytostelium subglobosum LB1]